MLVSIWRLINTDECVNLPPLDIFIAGEAARSAYLKAVGWCAGSTGPGNRDGVGQHSLFHQMYCYSYKTLYSGFTVYIPEREYGQQHGMSQQVAGGVCCRDCSHKATLLLSHGTQGHTSVGVYNSRERVKMAISQGAHTTVF